MNTDAEDPLVDSDKKSEEKSFKLLPSLGVPITLLCVNTTH